MITESVYQLIIRSLFFLSRFTFTGKITGGELKTTNEADEESLQAAWFPFDLVVNPQKGDLHLRSHDIIPLVQKTKLHSQLSQSLRQPALPLLVHHSNIILRLLMICPPTEGDQLWYVRKTSKSLTLPAVIVSPYESGLDAVANHLVHGELSSHISGKTCGLLNLEYQPSDRKPDGICINLVYSVESKNNKPPKVKNSQYTWEEVKNSDLQDLMKVKLQETGSVVIL